MKALTSLLLLLSFSTISASAAKANTLEAQEPQQPSEFAAEQENYLLAQALGYESEIGWDEYQLGTIKARAGNLISVVGLDDGLVFSGVIPSENGLNPRLLEGPNVLIGENDDGRKIVIEFVGPAWVETLMNDYGFSIEKDFRSDPPLEARTAPLWQQLGY